VPRNKWPSDTSPKDYKIKQRIIHPNYKPTSLYRDIALFLLERDIDFSPFVLPIYLTINNKLKSSNSYEMATGWGKTDVGDSDFCYGSTVFSDWILNINKSNNP